MSRSSSRATTDESGYAAVKRLLERVDRPDAIFCANDLMAMAAIDVARTDLGLRVPEDVSIVGFDDNERPPGPNTI